MKYYHLLCTDKDGKPLAEEEEESKKEVAKIEKDDQDKSSMKDASEDAKDDQESSVKEASEGAEDKPNEQEEGEGIIVKATVEKTVDTSEFLEILLYLEQNLMDTC